MNRTMHGLPAISLKDGLGLALPNKPDMSRSTMFGLPAINAATGEESSSGEDSTRVGSTSLGQSLRVHDQHNIRSTAMGGLPSLKRSDAPQRPAPTPFLQEDSENEDAGATMVAPSSLFDDDNPSNVSGFSRVGQRVGGLSSSKKPTVEALDDYTPEPMNQNATLMGMSIDELKGKGGAGLGDMSALGVDPKKTSFSLPNVALNRDLGQMLDDDDADDLPTQNISPQEIEQAAAGVSGASERKDSRKRLLEKLRASSQQEAARPQDNMRSTMFGIPGVAAPAPAPTPPAPAPAAEAKPAIKRAAPTSGVFKVVKPRDTEEHGPLEDSGVLSHGAYIVGKGEVRREHTGNLPRQLADDAVAQSSARGTIQTPPAIAPIKPEPIPIEPISAAPRPQPTPWVDPDQSQVPSIFGNATAAISADQIAPNLLAMRDEEPRYTQDSTRVGGADLVAAALGLKPAQETDAATRVGGADLVSKALAQAPMRTASNQDATRVGGADLVNQALQRNAAEPARPLLTPPADDLATGNISRPGTRVSAWREAAEDNDLPEPTLNMFDKANLPPIQPVSPPVIKEEPVFDATLNMFDKANLPPVQPATQPAPRPQPADPFSMPFGEERPGKPATAFPLNAELGDPHPMALSQAHDLSGAHPVPSPSSARPSIIPAALDVVGALALIAGAGLAASASAPVALLVAPPAIALLLLAAAFAPLPRVAKLALPIVAAIGAFGAMAALITTGAHLQIAAFIIGAGGLLSLVAAFVGAVKK
jgi:hypothetical protein